MRKTVIFSLSGTTDTKTMDYVTRFAANRGPQAEKRFFPPRHALLVGLDDLFHAIDQGDASYWAAAL